MPAVVLERVSFSYCDQVALLSDLSLTLPTGFTGVVGPNGAGKSTLLKLLAGELTPTQGRLRRPTPLARLDQTVSRLSPAFQALAASPEAGPWRARLGLSLDALDRFETLSPGERQRWQLAAALACEPELLLLDEPTNHLDAQGRAVLLNALKRFDGVGVVVSHDRTLLDILCQRTLRLSHGEATLYEGAYTQAERAWTEAEAHRQAQAAQLSREREAASARQVRAQQAQEAASAARSARQRMRSRHDSDARTATARNLADWASAAHGRKAAQSRADVAKLDDALSALSIRREPGRSVFARFEESPKALLCDRPAGPLYAGPRRLMTLPALGLRRGERVHLCGPNGVGKTTLFQALCQRADPKRCLVLPQELTTADGVALRARLDPLPPDIRAEVLGLVAALGVSPRALLASPIPSPGEARKLALAFALSHGAAALLLDEPTNHLDLPAITRLEALLGAFPGALLLVTHDEALARAVTQITWQLDADGLCVSHQTPPRLPAR